MLGDVMETNNANKYWFLSKTMHLKRNNYERKSSELLGSWTLPIVRFSRSQKKQRFGNWICFRPQVRGEDTYSVGSLRKS
jgi:hypothetical protein